tara:strand:+ start:118 stop:300 length:183 start_codon:yes stop_codon:yes gene_type:complete
MNSTKPYKMTEYEEQQIREYGFVKYKINKKPKQTTWTDEEIAHEEAIIAEEKRINNNKTL